MQRRSKEEEAREFSKYLTLAAKRLKLELATYNTSIDWGVTVDHDTSIFTVMYSTIGETSSGQIQLKMVMRDDENVTVKCLETGETVTAYSRRNDDRFYEHVVKVIEGRRKS